MVVNKDDPNRQVDVSIPLSSGAAKINMETVKTLLHANGLKVETICSESSENQNFYRGSIQLERTDGIELHRFPFRTHDCY